TAASRLRWWGDDRRTARASPISLRGGADNDDGLAADRKPDLYAGGAGKDVPSGSGVVSIAGSSLMGGTPLRSTAVRVPAAKRVPYRGPRKRQMSGAAQLAPSAVSGQGRIPVLDIGPFLAGEPDAAAPLARAVARTCDDT